MAYQEGSEALTSGTQDYTISFPLTFTSTPGIIIPVVANVSADATKLLINATIVAKDNSSFDVHLDAAPNTNNYTLDWVAGDISTLFQAIGILGIRMSQLPVQSVDPGGSDYFPFVSTVSLPVTKRITFAVLRAMFVNYVATPPASPAAAGSIGDYSVDTDGNVYFHTGVQWGRLSMQMSAWDVSSAPVVTQEGFVTLAASDPVPVITFGVPFVGSAPKITALVFSNTTAGTNLLLDGFVTGVTLTTFTLALNAAPDNSTYTLYWQAKQL